MAQNYTRQSSFNDGDTITASLFNDEYNQLVNAFTYSSTSESTTGHRHDGSANQGGNIFKIGDLDFLNKIEVDSTNNRWGFYVEVSSAAVEQIRIQDGSVVPVTTNDIDLGTASLQFKDLYIDGTANVDSLILTSGSTVTTILDEDDMSSDSDTALVTQQSVKAYVDAQVTAQDFDFQADTGGALSIDLDSETMTFTGGTGIDTSGALNEVTFAIDSTVATLTGTQTLTNKTLTSPDIDGGTIDGTVIGGTTPAAVSATTVSATGNITVGGTVDGRDVATDGTKLDGIESGATADQTAAEIRTLVEAATDSNVFTDADHTKLDGIEAGATADQTDAEIRAAVEAATDSNVFTDADHTKLDGIEAGADVTDTTNVTAAGAVMDSELTNETAVKSLDQSVATTDSPTFAGLTTTADVSFGDNDKAVFGAGSDLQIYHDGTDSIINEGTAGNLLVQGATIKLQTANGLKDYLVASPSAEISLYYDNSPKLATTATGIDVTGSVISDGATIAGTLELDSNAFTHTALTPNYNMVESDVTGENTQFIQSSGLFRIRTVDDSLGNAVERFRIDHSTGDVSFFGSVAGQRAFHWDSSADALGIGTVSPSTALEVVGTVTADGLTVDGATLLNNGTNSTHLTLTGTASRGLTISTTNPTGQNDAGVIYDAQDTAAGGVGSHEFRVGGESKLLIAADGDISFYEDTGTTAKLFWDASAESLGIGTTSPSAELDVDGQVAIGKSGNNDIGSETDLALYGNAIISSVNSLNLGVQSSGYMAFYTGLTSNTGGTAGGTERVRLTSTGALNVNDSDITGASNALFNVANSDSSLWSAINTGANAYSAMPSEIAVMNTQDDTANSFGGIFFQGGETSAGSAINAARIGGIRESTGSANTALAFAVRGTSGMLEAMRIDSSYNVGINEAAPDYQLHVNSGTTNVVAKFESTDSTSVIQFVDPNGNSEFGTSGNTARISPNGSYAVLEASQSAVVLNNASQDTDFRVESDSNSHALFLDAGNGRLGVNESAPSQALDVNGNIAMSGAGTGSRYLILDETNTYAGSLVMQAGAGSAAYGASIVAYGHSHATKPGDIVAGISSGSGGKFRVNTTGIDTGSNVFVAQSNGFCGFSTDSPLVNIHSKSTSTGEQLRLESTNSGGAYGPLMGLYRNSATPGNGDGLGQIHFYGESSAGNQRSYATIGAIAANVSNGVETGRLIIATRNAGIDEQSRIDMLTGGTVFNQGGVDLDFVVESDNNANMLYVDAGNNRVGIGKVPLTNALDVSTSMNIEGDASPSGNGLALGDYGTTGAYKWIQSFNSQPLRLNPLGNEVSIGITGTGANFKTFGNAVFNEDGGSTQDFRVESDSQTHALFVDAGNDAVGLFTSAPSTALDVRIGGAGTSAATVASGTGAGIFLENNGTAEKPYFVSKTHNPGDGTAIGGVKFATSPDGANYNWAGVLAENSSSGNAGRLRFYTSGSNSSGDASTLRMSILEDGKVGINNSSPPNRLSLLATSYAGSVTNISDIDGIRIDGTLASDGRIGYEFQAGGGGGAAMTMGRGGAYDTFIEFYTNAYSTATSGAMTRAAQFDSGQNFITYSGAVFNENSADADFRVESDSNTHMLFVDAGNNRVGINKSSPEESFHVSSISDGRRAALFDPNVLSVGAGASAVTVGIRGQKNACLELDRFYTHGPIQYFKYGNTVVGSVSITGSATTYNTSSDARLKENIADADDAGDLIDAIQVRQFDWIADGEHQRYGMVAQELNTVAPEAVSEGETEEDMMGVDYSKLVPMLIKEIQSLRARVAQLESN